jgi:predicted enzyme related to lactoylglutathione lyase
VFTSMFPILSSRDLPRLLQFYVGALDAEVVYQFPPEGEAFFVSVDVAGTHLGLGYDEGAAGTEVGQRAALWFYTDSCDQAVARLESAGATVLSTPTDMPWGERVAHLHDPDGNPIHIGQRLEGADG